MAIQKSVETSHGYTANYFKISDLRQDKRLVRVSVDLYKDATARDAGKAPVEKNYRQKVMSLSGAPDWSFELTIEQFESPDSNVYEYAYDYLKSLSHFSGATDI